MNQIRFAIIGTNFITSTFLEAAASCDCFVLSAFYSRSIEKAKSFAQKYHAPLYFDDLEALAQCEDVDAVYIASPTACHYRQSMLMLRNHKHVLCEKPATTNSHELERLLQIAKERNCIFLEAIRNVFTPGYACIKDNLYKIGKVRRATFVFCKYSSRYDAYKKGVVENAFRPELSNGAIMDIGVYGIHMMTSLFGTPYSLTAKGLILPGSIDGQGMIAAKYKHMQTEVIYSKISNSYLPCEIQGEEGSMVFSSLSEPEKIKIILKNGEKETIIPDTIKPDMFYEISIFMDMIHGNRKDVDLYNQNSVDTMRLMDDARKQMDIVFPNDF